MANYITTLKDDNEVDTLSPTTVLKAVRDDNGNYLDNGLAASDINKLKGGEVTKLEENLARIETSPTTHAYSVGERLVYNGILYRVKAAISVGADLVVDTNIEKKSVDDALSDIIGTIVTNSNGYGFKLPNGVIVNVMTNIGKGGSVTQSGSFWYHNDTTTYNFPIPYVDSIPSCFGMNNVDAWAVVGMILRNKNAITRISFFRPNNDSIYVSEGDVKFIAVGR